MKIGANYARDGKCYFTVWAPVAKTISLKLQGPVDRLIPMERDELGYWRVEVNGVYPGTFYTYEIDDDRERPDPASHFQPDGVHAPSCVVDHTSFDWTDASWKGIAPADMIMYEIHVGTFSEKGTFAGIIPHLDDLVDLGITAIEIMPVAQFPGERNWGYDGTYPFAVQNSYGGPDGLKQLVDECHRRGIAVILDVVYNHLGPEGNYIWDFGPYFTDRYRTPWGNALNFDGPHSNDVRDYFIENALHWFGHYHIDALRLDAVHGIIDMSARHFLHELAGRVDEFSNVHGKRFYLIAESDLNNPGLAQSAKAGGYGLDAVWSDDFHHALHTLLTGESDGYYMDFGKVEHLKKAMSEGYVYSGGYSLYRKRKHGSPSSMLPSDRFVVSAQNHDQIGNRMKGERLSTLISFEAQKLAAGVLMLSPYVPLLFMGEEYGETAPFLYFVSHSDQNLIQAVQQGRKEEFSSFNWREEPPDPQSADTFTASRLDRNLSHAGHHRVLLSFYKKLIQLRKETYHLTDLNRNNMKVWADEESGVLVMRRWHAGGQLCVFFNFNERDTIVEQPIPEGEWNKKLESSASEWDGPGSALPERMDGDAVLTMPKESFVLYEAVL